MLGVFKLNPIWSSGENPIGSNMTGRQISNCQEEVHKRGILKIKYFIYRESTSTDVFISVLLANAIILL